MNNCSVVEKIRNNGEQEIEKIYKANRDEFLSWARRNFSCSFDDAKEVYQQSIVIFYENIMSGKITEFRSQVKTYLFAIGKNKLLESIRDKNRVQSMEDENIIENIDLFSFDEEHEQNLVLVEQAISKLGDPCRKLLQQYYYHKKSMADIAELMDYKNADTVKNLKYKCLQRLKKLFNQELNAINREES